MKLSALSRRNFIKNMSLSALAINVPLARPTRPADKETSKSENMSKTTADILMEKLIAWKVEYIFGVVGDGVNPIFEAMRKNQDKIKYISARHEEAAAFMASGYAKYTGKLGVCIGTSGPGAVHLMNGLYDAAMENAPVLAITGSPFHNVLGTSYTQEVDTVALMKDVAVYNQMVNGPQQAMTVIDLACRIAMSTPGVAHLTFAKDVQQKALSDDKPGKDTDNLQGYSTYTPRIMTPALSELQAAAAILNQSKKTMILCGRGALNCRKEVEQLAEKLGAPVAKALLGKAVLPDDSPYTTGGIGHLGTLPSKEMMHDCDTLLILGSNMPHLEYYPKEGQAKTIQIDRDEKRIGLRCAIDMGLVGDVNAAIAALLPLIAHKSDRSFLQKAQGRMKDWREKLAGVESRKSTPIKPQYLVAQASQLLKNDALIAIDTGAHTVFTARHLQLKADQKVIVSGNLATMAPGLPYSIAAQLAYPGRQCVAFVGDGGFTMLMGEVVTAVRYNLPIKVIIFKNNHLSMDRFEQEEMGGKDYGIDLTPIDFVKVAEACGAEGYHCATSDEVSSTLKKAFASSRPCIIEVDVDPDENPAPPDKV